MLFLSSTLVRLPFAINGLAILLFLRETSGSFGLAGLGAGAVAVGAGAGAPLIARLVDRRGAAIVLPLACVHSGSLVAIVVLGEAGAAGALLVALAGLAGITFPPTGSLLRARFPKLLADRPALVPSAYALDSILIEVSFVSGPLLTAAIVAFSGPSVALLVSSALLVGGTVMFLSAMPREEKASERAPRGILGALASPGVRMIALTTVPIGFSVGAVEVALPAFSHDYGQAELGGVLLALWSLASAIGGVVYGARATGGDPSALFLRIAWLFPLATLPLAAAGAPVTVAAGAMLAGLPIAPLIACRNELLGRLAPERTVTEAFTWLMSALLCGSAAGAAIAGVIVETSGWELAVLAGVGVAALGAVATIGGRRALVPAAELG
jgi:MFS family permease